MENTRKTLRSLSGIVKDKSSLSFNPRSSVIVKSTTHGSTSAPKKHRIDALLSVCHEKNSAAAKCIETLMNRLQNTGNAFVALKCLYVVHTILAQGSLTLRNHLSTSPSNGRHNLVNLSRFRDDYNSETMEFSSWVRWYSEFLEQSMITSRVLGYYLYPPPPFSSSSSSSSSWVSVRKAREKKIIESSSFDLSRELETLVCLVTVICRAPASVHLQKNELIYAIVRSVGDDYRMLRYEISLRLMDLVGRLESVSCNELTRLLDVLEKFEDCKGKLFLLFVNKASKDGLWEVIHETKKKSMGIKMRRTNPFLGLGWTSS